MKFTGVIGDERGVDFFAKSVLVVSKLCRRRIVMMLSADEVVFVNAHNVREGYAIDYRITQKDVFSTYNFDGLTKENNYIYLEVNTQDLLHAVQGKEGMLKIKLVGKGANKPTLKFEMMTSRVTHEIPLTFIPQRCWPDYGLPQIGLASVMTGLPSIKVLQTILNSVKNMGAKTVTFKINNNGEMKINSSIEMAKVEVYVHDLVNITLQGGNSEDNMNPMEYFSVILDLQVLSCFLGSLHLVVTKLLMKIIHGRAAIFFAKHPNGQFKIVMTGLNMGD